MDYREKCLSQKLHCCNICGASGELLVHHIDGDRSNNELGNLIPLCDGCHRKVHRRSTRGPVIDTFTSRLPDHAINDGPYSGGKSQPRVRMSDETWVALNQKKDLGDALDDVIKRLLDAAGAAKEDEEGNAQPTPTTAD